MPNIQFSAGTIIDSAIDAARFQENNVFDDWLDPSSKEWRQLGEQALLEQASPELKMRGMRSVGINPLTAAHGIAGSSASSVPQPASSVNPLGDVAGAVGGVAGALGSAAGAFNDFAGGVSVLGKLGSEIVNLKADTSEKLSNIGLTNAQTQGVLTDNKYKDDDWKATLNVKRQQFENMKAEWSNIKATHDEIIKHIAEMQSQIELNGSQADYLDSFKAKLDEETRFLTAKNDFCIAHNLFLLESGLDGYIFSMVESGSDMTQFDSFVDIYTNYREKVSYAEQSGSSKAERLFGSSKSPWELGDKYLKRFVDWVKSNSDNPDVQREQISQIYIQLQHEHPSWDTSEILAEMQRMGFTADELQAAFK